MSQSVNTYDVIVLGAGAAGLFSAITAAKKNKRVLVIEKSNKAGKKILMSGGGKCNFTNHFVNPDNFISKNEHFCKSALSSYSPQDFIDLVDSYGIEHDTKKRNQLFCVKSAKDIVQLLLNECDLHNVDIIKNTNATKVHFNKVESNYSVSTISDKSEDKIITKYISSSLIVATGALSIPTLGGSGFGYDLAKQFNLSVTSLRAGLVPFIFTDYMSEVCEKLSGISHGIRISCNGQTFEEDILFTHRGLSGPAVLQISSYWKEGDDIAINLLPSHDAYSLITEAKQESPKLLLRSFLNTLMSKALVAELESLLWDNLSEKPLAEWSKAEITLITNNLNNWLLKPSSTEGYRTAEVTLGGVDVHQISSKTMEVLNQPGLYFIGEVLDVTGHLGGFNFQWAWASGHSAGLNA
jgi:predicted Rossmann fold flavoprotein